MKLELTLTKEEIVAKFAAELGVDPSKVTLCIVEDEPEEKEEQPQIEVTQTGTRFLDKYLKKNKITLQQAVESTGMSATTIKRACQGYHLNSKSYLKVIHGLCMSDDEALEFKSSMTRHQRG